MGHYAFLLHNSLPGHGILIWALAGLRPREEFIEVSPEGFKLWGKPFTNVEEMLKWFKHIGWKNASKLRKDFQQSWDRKKRELEEKRGKDAFSDMPRRVGTGWAAKTTTSGLQTPGGAGGLRTPSGGIGYGMEAAAPTPTGLFTPAGMGSGIRTPNPQAVPGSPAPNVMHSGLSTPRGFIPGTPRGQIPGTPRGIIPGTPRAVPSTPVGLAQFAPGTPAALRGGVPMQMPIPNSPGGPAAAPSTPAGLLMNQPNTPGGQVPQTPAFPSNQQNR